MIDTTTARTVSQRQLQTPRAAPSVFVAPVAILLLGTVSISLYFWGRDLHRFTQWLAAYLSLFIAQLALYLLGCYVVWRWSDRSSRIGWWATVVLVILFGAASRAVLVPQRPYLSSDVYRYVWDGHVQAAGINPYQYVPEAEELRGLRDNTIYPRINPEDKHWRSPYPPVAQLVFAAIGRIAPMSVTAFKAAMSWFDLVTVLLLMLGLARCGIDPARAIIFAWHPLVIFEGAHSGHIESVYVALLALALFVWSTGRRWIAGIPLGLATLVKFFPALVLPVFLGKGRDALTDPANAEGQLAAAQGFRGLFRRLIDKSNLAIVGAFTGTVLLAYGPYLNAGSNSFWFLSGYMEQEGFVESGARYFLLDAARRVMWIPTEAFLIFAAGSLLSLAVWQILRVKRDLTDVARGALALIGSYLLLTTPRYAWYYIWLVPFLCFAPRLGWLYLTCASALLYLVWYTPLIYPEVPLWLGACIYLPTLAWLLWELNSSRRREKRTIASILRRDLSI